MTTKLGALSGVAAVGFSAGDQEGELTFSLLTHQVHRVDSSARLAALLTTGMALRAGAVTGETERA